MLYAINNLTGPDALANGYADELLTRLKITAANRGHSLAMELRNELASHIWLDDWPELWPDAWPDGVNFILTVDSTELPAIRQTWYMSDGWDRFVAGRIQLDKSKLDERETYPEFFVHCVRRVTDLGNSESTFKYSMYGPGRQGRRRLQQTLRETAWRSGGGIGYDGIKGTSDIGEICSAFLRFMLAFQTAEQLVEIGADPSIDLETRVVGLRIIPRTSMHPWKPGQRAAYEAILHDDNLPVLERIRVAYELRDYGDPFRDSRFELLTEIFDRSDLPIDIEFSATLDLGGTFALERLAKLMHSPDAEVAEKARDRLQGLTYSPSEPEPIRRAAFELSIGQHLSVGHAFVSYVREDSDEVDGLVKELNSHGIAVWRDKEEIDGGDRWRDKITEAIQDGDAFVAVFSHRSEQRSRSYMRDELMQAVAELRLRPRDRAWFVPVKLSECDIPAIPIGAGETLRDLQYVAVYEPRGLERLVKSLASSLISR